VILVTGATGYVGGRLVPRLLADGRRVRVLARDPSRLAGRAWLPRVEVATGDVLDPATLAPALGRVSTAYYLVHGMAEGGRFGERDLAAAEAFGRAARQAGVERIVYLGALGDPATGLSAHLRSRQETGERLRAAGVPVTELRAEGAAPAVRLSAQEGMIVERRQLPVPAPPEALFRSFAGLGGERGWLYANWAWRLRGAVDRLVGGVGFRRGRRDRDQLRAGDALDFWRVEAVEPPSLLRLRAEMKLPGRAWLQLEARPAQGGSVLVQTAYFAPRGLPGHLYWYALYPAHAAIFRNLVRRVAERARTPRPPAAARG